MIIVNLIMIIQVHFGKFNHLNFPIGHLQIEYFRITMFLCPLSESVNTITFCFRHAVTLYSSTLCAARLICRRKKHDHVTPLLKELHWLPIHVRPTYKLLTIAYSLMHGLAPEYLAELLDRHHPRRVLRSASAELFSVPFSQTVRHGDRRFSVAVATLWNQLPNAKLS